jgi:hypothetical protein
MLLPLLLAAMLRTSFADPKELKRRWPGLVGDGLVVQQLREADPYDNLTPDGVPHAGGRRVALHLAITSCDVRLGWASTLSST